MKYSLDIDAAGRASVTRDGKVRHFSMSFQIDADDTHAEVAITLEELAQHLLLTESEEGPIMDDDGVEVGAWEIYSEGEP